MLYHRLHVGSEIRKAQSGPGFCWLYMEGVDSLGVKEEFLRIRMEEKGISQADLARKTDIPPGTISSFLRSDDGIEKTSYGNVRKICEALDLKVDDLDRVGPDGRLPEPAEEPVPVPEAPEEGAAAGTVPDAEDTEGGYGSVDESFRENAEEGEKEKGPAAGVISPPEEDDGKAGDTLEEEGLLEIKRYYVASRLSACSEEDVGHMVSVIPSVRAVEENGVYAVRLPESRMVVLRKIWRMEDGLLLLSPDRFDEVPRIIRPDTEGFSVVGRVVENEELADYLC